MKKPDCPNCQTHLTEDDKFCPNCGNPVKEKMDDRSSNQDVKTISSRGNYSGKMTKGKTSGSWKIIRNVIIVLVVLGIIAIIIWYQTDSNAKEKLGNILFGFVVMAIFAAVIWRKSRKGLMKPSKDRKDNFDWDDNVEPEVDSDDDYDD